MKVRVFKGWFVFSGELVMIAKKAWYFRNVQRDTVGFVIVGSSLIQVWTSTVYDKGIEYRY